MSVRNIRAYRIYLILSAVTAFANTTMFTVLAVYKVQVVHLDPFQLVLVGTVLEASYFLAEVPTGLFADTFSRRRSVLFGIFAIGVGWLVEGSLPLFATILVGEVIIGIGEAFLNGAEQAWIAGEVGEDEVGPLFLRASQVGQIAAVGATFVSIALGTIAINLPILVGGALFLGLGVFLVFAMPETGFNPVRQAGHTQWQSMSQTLRDGVHVVRGRPVLLSVLALSAIQGLASEGYDRLWEAHLLTDIHLPPLFTLPPLAWFGVINIVGMLLGAAATEGLRRSVDTNRPRIVLRALFGLQTVQVGAIVLFALAPTFPLAVAALLFADTIGNLIGPLHNAWVTGSIEPRVRATVLSFTGQANAIAQVVGGPPVGAFGRIVSLPAALAVTGLLRIPAIFIYGKLFRQAADTPGAQPAVTSGELA